MINKFFGWIFLFIFSAICCGNTYSDIKSRMIKSFSKQMKRTQNLKVFGTGGSGLGYIRTIAMVFISNKKVDLMGARVLAVETAKEFIEKMNKDKKFQEYAQGVLFTDKNLELGILFEDPKTNKFYEDRLIASVNIIEGKMHYTIFLQGNLKTIHQETYEEALKMVEDYKAHTPEQKSKDPLP